MSQNRKPPFLKMPEQGQDHWHRHGGPYDRGCADRYYSRKFAPHYFRGATHQSKRIEEEDMTPQQIKNYKYGYDTASPHDSGEADTVYLRGRKD
jgi:hypothetical protein